MPKKNVVAEEQSTEPAIPRLAFSMRESAGALGISYISVHRLVKRGLLRTSGALRNKLIAKTELERFLPRRRPATLPPVCASA